MHELSIVANILDTVEESAIKHEAAEVTEIELEIGELSGVEYDALDFAFSHAPRSSLFRKTVFKILRIKSVARCHDCDAEFPVSHYATPCPCCSSFKTELIRGNELRIKSFSFD
ncbi:MAG: hydrogenase maturation nickel metallochaperone HypA [Bacteroidales bacterium]|nr:hydrogenase maturation nickel metallochaperone HypA [Bacteroidales bacterium]